MKNIAVVGAGIVGICSAYFLKKSGFKVTLIDRDNPGNKSAYYGNSGHFSPYGLLSL